MNQANREVIVDFLARKLKVGGVAYLSYNTYPGWSANSTLRHLMVQHDLRMGAPGRGAAGRVTDALRFVDRLFETEPMFSRRVPSIRDRYNSLRHHSQSYRAHEFFNRNWQPFYFSEVAEALAPAKLELPARQISSMP